MTTANKTDTIMRAMVPSQYAYGRFNRPEIIVHPIITINC